MPRNPVSSRSSSSSSESCSLAATRSSSERCQDFTPQSESQTPFSCAIPALQCSARISSDPLDRIDRGANKTLDVIEYLIPSIKDQLPDLRGQPFTPEMLEEVKRVREDLPGIRARLAEEVDQGCPDLDRLGAVLVNLIYAADYISVAAERSDCPVEALRTVHLKIRREWSYGNHYTVLARHALAYVDNWLSPLLEQIQEPPEPAITHTHT
ncbi:hypothetical protein NBRC10513_008262 [Rhodotorula toruloides]